MGKARKVQNWGRYPAVNAEVFSFRNITELKQFVSSTSRFITRGSGLSYGDASLAPVILSTLRYNKILAFNKAEGIIRCESGVTLSELLKVVVPAGWFLPVVPGTKNITVGGAVAADVHGKNHHVEGSFTRYVSQLSLLMHNGDVLDCSREENSETFHSTCGGMGLTGVVLDVEIRLKKVTTAYVTQRNMVVPNLRKLIEGLKANEQSTYSVAWVDCLASGKDLGRGVVMLGEHAQVDDLPLRDREFPLKLHKKAKLRIPIDMPSFLLNGLTIGAFNSLYYHFHRMARKEFTAHYDSFFFPLDFMLDWNKLYGKRGMLQYQFVIPFGDGEAVLSRILAKISKSRMASFLSVLKLLGPGEHPLSFPMPGYTLAMDFPVTEQLFPLLNELDKIVAGAGGRIYLAKDSRMNLETFANGYPEISRFRALLAEKAGIKFGSLQSERLSIVK